MRTGFGVVCCFAIGAFASGMAESLPGQKIDTAVAAIHRKPFKTEKIISEMSGLPMYNAAVRFAGASLAYHIEDTPDHISFQERLVYHAPRFNFLNKRDPRVREILRMVYDDRVARDFLDSRRVATVAIYRSKPGSVFLRGARFGYDAWGDKLTLFARKDLGRRISLARHCATIECGD